ncbi:hypothetical protein LVB77_21065 [Lysobacter sp. 5GHs7-4]|uniref:hypothetical protein n=1 Tax=Lysobacter sp. 5GHs7-4 TaxID=2904253 RepID=UPI001E33617D|nr:hypothetical protein [Lysobacter sp. 5GHs7-4]UHQ23100.1 hypothetical protein LVB77_21065 [Lysobacter sp. 5GHs7-4]
MRSPSFRTALWATVALALAASAGCARPKPPEKERPVDPQATQLRDSIQQPIQKAQAVEADVLEAADKQRDSIEAQAN